eukprot:3018783-Amphidinium_carterae.2
MNDAHNAIGRRLDAGLPQWPLEDWVWDTALDVVPSGIFVCWQTGLAGLPNQAVGKVRDSTLPGTTQDNKAKWDCASFGC